MRKLISLVLLFCFSFNVLASTGTIQELERHIDNYQYAMTVEWDQKDEAFYQKETQKFFGHMETLIREGGLSKVEVLTLVEKRFSNKAALEALKLKLSLLSQTDSSEELASTLKDSAKNFYSQGASWNGQILIPLGIGIVIVAIIAYKWWWEANHKCSRFEERFDCTTTSWDDRNCTTYTDDQGFQQEDCDYYWQREDTTTCGMMNFCLEYEKI